MTRVDDTFDLAIVGAGMIGLAHAVAAHERGLRVIIIDRSDAPRGASVRNFGHLGFSAHAGEAAGYAARSLALWPSLARRAGFWLGESGTLVVARHDDELALLEESGQGHVLTADAISALAPVVGACGGIVHHGDMQVDPREVAPAIARYLAAEGIAFLWQTAATGADSGVLRTTRGTIRATAIVFAIGADVDGLFPEVAATHEIKRCALDMLLTDGVGLTMPLLTGSSLLRYSATATLPTASVVRARYAQDEPDLLTRDVNQMYTERPDGTLLVGDTHLVSAGVSPFQDEAAFELLERLGAEMFGRALRVRQRWQGVYAKAPTDFLRVTPADGIRIVAVTTGIGMTTGLGLGEAVVTELFGAT